MTFSPNNSIAPYLVNSVDFANEINKLSDQLTQVYSLISTAVNVRDIAFYINQEQLSGGQLFTPGNPQKTRYLYRQCYNFGALPAKGVTKTLAHGLDFSNPELCFVEIYGAATQPTVAAIPVPYVKQNKEVEIDITSTDISIYSHEDYSMYTTTIITLVYTKG